MPNAAPTSPASNPAASEATQGRTKGTGKPGGSPGATKGPTRRARQLEAKNRKEIEALSNKSTTARARALKEVCAEVSGDRGPPVPLSLACEAHGVPHAWALEALARGDLPELDAARARGRIMVARAACGDGPEARQFAWLAERLDPKRFHLPTKITGVSAEDGGAPIQAATVAVQLTADGRRRELQAIAAEAQAALAALPAGK